MLTMVASSTTISWASPRNARTTHRRSWWAGSRAGWNAAGASSDATSIGTSGAGTLSAGCAARVLQPDAEVPLEDVDHVAREQVGARGLEVHPVGDPDLGDDPVDAQEHVERPARAQRQVRVDVHDVVPARGELLEGADRLPP